MRTRNINILIILIVLPLVALTLLPMGTLVVTISFISPSPSASPIRVKIEPATSKTLVPSSSISVTVVVANKSLLPDAFSLSQNYPNPFNPQTIIRYTLPKDCHVELTIYNTLGQKVKTLVNQYQNAGNKMVQWNSRDDKGNEVGSGIYFYRIKADSYTAVKKMVVIK